MFHSSSHKLISPLLLSLVSVLSTIFELLPRLLEDLFFLPLRDVRVSVVVLVTLGISLPIVYSL